MGVRIPVGVEFVIMSSISGCSTPDLSGVSDHDDSPDETNVSVNTPDYMPDPPSNQEAAFNKDDDQCRACPTDPECPHNDERDGNKIQSVGCSVNTLYRQFHDDVIDVAVKVQGGMITTKRFFNGSLWASDFDRTRLTIDGEEVTMPRDQWYSPDSASDINVCDSEEAEEEEEEEEEEADDHVGDNDDGIDDDDDEPEQPSSMFTNICATFAVNQGCNKPVSMGFGIGKPDDSQLNKRGPNWFREWPDGTWMLFTSDGILLEYGNRTGTVARLIYGGGYENVIGLADRNSKQVVWYEYDSEDRVSAIHDNQGQRVEYEYTDGRLSRVLDSMGLYTVYEYNSDGLITRKIDQEGRSTIISYSKYGDVTSVVDDQGNGHFFEYDYDKGKKRFYAMITSSSGMVKEIWYNKRGETIRVDINGRTVEKIEGSGRKINVLDEKGNSTRKKFNEHGSLLKIDRSGVSKASFKYDPTINEVTHTKDPRGIESTYKYNLSGALMEKKEGIGAYSRTTLYAYDSDQQVTSATILADHRTEGATARFTYDDAGNISSVTDPMGGVARILAYNNLGSPEQIQDRRGNVWELEYDNIGRLISSKNPLNHTTSYEYDGVNNVTAMVDALSKRYEFEYDDHNNLTKATDPYSKSVVIDYNTDDLPTRIVDREGKVWTNQYDNEGRLIKTLDGAGNETRYHYDESMSNPALSDRPVRIDYPTFSRHLYYDKLQRIIKVSDISSDNVAHTRTFEYDALSQVTAMTDEEGNTTRYEYDGFGRVVVITDPMGGEIRRILDNRGNLIELLDPKNGSTFYTYDKNNQLIKLIKPMKQETTYEYGENGNQTAIIDSKGQRLEYGYDAANRLTRVEYFKADDHATPVKTIDFTYDAVGNLLSYYDGFTSASYTYDDLGRKTGESVNYGPFTLGNEYTYFANSLKKSFTGPDGETIGYSYDDNNRLTGISIPGQGYITYGGHQWNSP
ncbi:MAG: RHS repeat protein, partial [FCB group bacterium]|nr:RHS repeat protein [FCB group bacterium]